MGAVASRLFRLLSQFFRLLGVEPSSTNHREKWISALGAFLGIAMVYAVSFWYLDQQGALLMVASMGASAVLLFAVPHGAFSQPWPLVAGHLISAFIGISCYRLLGETPFAAPLAVSLSVVAMHYGRCLHPPGGGTALIAVIGSDAVHGMGYQLMFYPIGINLAAILAVAVLYNSPFPWRRYPGYLAARPIASDSRRTTVGSRSTVGATREFALTQEDFTAAMQELNSLVGVTPEDLAQIFEYASEHAERNREQAPRLSVGCCYSNGLLGRHWRIRQVLAIEAPLQASPAQVNYRTLAGEGQAHNGRCTMDEFLSWAAFEVKPSGGHWVRIRSTLPEGSGDN